MNEHDKLNTAYGIKSTAVEIKDVDETNRIVKGYLSSFNTKDSDNDVIRKGAFKKSLKERGVNSKANRRIAHLRNHDWDWQIGVFKELAEDDFGLYFISELGRSTKGTDALLDYQDGILREHSIGFNYVEGKIKKKEDEEHGEYFEIKEVMLWEGSGVTFGANQFTPVLEANKSIMDSEYLAKLNAEMDVLVKAVKNGKGTDERLENIEFKLKQIQQKYNALLELKSFDKDTLIESHEEKAETLKEATQEEVQKALKDAQLKEFYLNILN